VLDYLVAVGRVMLLLVSLVVFLATALVSLRFVFIKKSIEIIGYQSD
jgi:hypothetical protein